jgi:hypothetical protein
MLEHTHTTVVTRRPTHVRCHMWSLTVRDGGFRTNMLVEACEEDENPCETHAVGDTASLARRHDVPADFSSAMVSDGRGSNGGAVGIRRPGGGGMYGPLAAWKDLILSDCPCGAANVMHNT